MVQARDDCGLLQGKGLRVVKKWTDLKIFNELDKRMVLEDQILPVFVNKVLMDTHKHKSFAQ